ncbi:MAG TPA: SIMPL domain-containing protein [Longimicrobiales bacterium]|nr:SIMPL domain-containing protein [Longimicrobiales bacterium]
MRHGMIAPAAGLALLFATAGAWAQAPAQPAMAERTITVTATGTATRQPDRARVLLAVETVAVTADAATDANSRRMEAVFAALRALGLGPDQLRTTGFELYPEYARDRPVDQPEPRIVGYRARNSIQATVDDVTRVGEVLDAAISAGADRVMSLWFELQDPAAARADALRDAVAKARAEAEAIAGALGEPLGPVLDISTTGATPVRAPMPLAAARDMAYAEAVPVEPGELDISAFVTAVFRIGNPAQ